MAVPHHSHPHNNTVSCDKNFCVDQVTAPPPPRGKTRGGGGGVMTPVTQTMRSSLVARCSLDKGAAITRGGGGMMFVAECAEHDDDSEMVWDADSGGSDSHSSDSRTPPPHVQPPPQGYTVPPRPGGNRHQVTVPPLGGETVHHSRPANSSITQLKIFFGAFGACDFLLISYCSWAK